MVSRTKDGEATHLYYENVGMGAARNEEDESVLYLVFTDRDNLEIHLYPVELTKLEQYINLIRQTAANQKIEIATDMPRGPRSA